MKKITLLFFTVSLFSFSQATIEGFIFDEFTGETLPYATIRVLNTKYYTITNEDGKFELSLGEDIAVDSLEVRFMGFVRKKVAISYFKTNTKLYLTPHVSAIDVVHITNKKYRNEKNYTRDILNELIQKYRKDELITDSKAFLSLTSSARNVPIEHIEGFYNSKQSVSSGLGDLSIKSGRFGQNKSFPFYSLDNTVILKNFQFFKKNTEQILPLFPGNMTQGSIKGKYKITLEECTQCDLEDVSISFVPKNFNGRLFSGKIIFDERKLIIKKIALWIENPETHGLSSVGENDNFIPKKIKLDVIFNPLDLKKIQHLDFVFDIQYNSKTSSEYIESRSFLYFYDYQKSFKEPYFTKEITFKNDYDKIVALQTSEEFWKENYQFPKSYNDIRSINFMKEYGYLINYDNTIPKDYIKFIKPSVISWSKDNRLSWEGIKYGLTKKVKEVDGRVLNLGDAKVVDKVARSTSDLAGNKLKTRVVDKIDFSYVLDLYKDKSGVNQLTSRTVFDRKASFFKSNRTKNKLIYLNLVFDIYEYHRRSLDSQSKYINQMSYAEIKKMYDEKFFEATALVKKMKKETGKGTKYQNLIKWNKMINDILAIDNYKIISKKD
ncbi:MAG: hypothetical protein COA67_04795 [Lutibacter sp.]|nr:MAG: hypothetical protein COA67_04795 [Lutibacter sp.]